MTPTPAELAERVLERNETLLKGVNVPGGLMGDQWRRCCDDQAADAPILARAYLAALRALKEADAALIALYDDVEELSGHRVTEWVYELDMARTRQAADAQKGESDA